MGKIKMAFEIADEQPEKSLHPFLKKILERGIPVSKADFITAIDNSEGTPESSYHMSSSSASRRVRMWWINGDGLVCFHKGKYFLVPTGMVKSCRFE